MKSTTFAVLLLALAGMGLTTTGCITGCDRGYSDGERTGTIVKLSHKGIFIKSWEGQMNLGGTASDAHGNLVPTTWEFTVRDPAVIEQVQAAQKSGQRVTIRYTQWLASPIGMESDYEAIEVTR